MGKKSTRENKNVFFQAREEAGLTRAQASELMPGYSESQIEKIENERVPIQPDMVLAMARAYKRPDLCNQYCANYCPIGDGVIPDVQVNSLSEIVLGMLSTMNAFEAKKNRLIDISVDGEISDNELYDYVAIQEELTKMAISIEAFRIWIDKKVASGNIDAEKIERIRTELKE